MTSDNVQTVNSILSIAAVGIPEVAALIKAVFAFRKKYPGIPPADILNVVISVTEQADTAFDDVLAKIEADQAVHPTA
jgi:hypothetical protein